jgi:prepilin-type N-terminal cleavage/methylation domain-containing protein
MIPSHQRGYSLVELMVALVIMGIVTGAIYKLLDNTQRISRSQAEQVALQANTRGGILIVPNELREINVPPAGAPAGSRNDIIAKSPNSITYRAMRGTGFVCQAIVAGSDQIKLSGLTWMGPRPAGGDSMFVFVENTTTSSADDRWVELRVANYASVANGCPGTPANPTPSEAILLTMVDDTIPGPGGSAVNVTVGSPVRTFEVMEMRLYVAAADGKSWLGARSVSADEEIQPVLGPLVAGDGLRLEYFDLNGAATTVDANIRSIQVRVKGVADAPMNVYGSSRFRSAPAQDTLTARVALRNAPQQ